MYWQYNLGCVPLLVMFQFERVERVVGVFDPCLFSHLISQDNVCFSFDTEKIIADWVDNFFRICVGR